MPKDNIFNPLIRVGISSENKESRPKNQGYYIGLTDIQAKEKEVEREVKKKDSITRYQAIQTQRKHAVSDSMCSCGLTLQYDYKNAIPRPVTSEHKGSMRIWDM